MTDGTLSAGTRVPSTRARAAESGVSRTTVTAVYDQLAAEGFIVTSAAPTAIEPIPFRTAWNREIPGRGPGVALAKLVPVFHCWGSIRRSATVEPHGGGRRNVTGRQSPWQSGLGSTSCRRRSSGSTVVDTARQLMRLGRKPERE